MTMRRLAPAAFAAWLVTLLVSMSGTLVVAAARDASSIGELAPIYLPVMSIPFAIGVGLVLWPLMSLAQLLLGLDRLWFSALVGIAIAPVQMLVLMAAGRVAFGPITNYSIETAVMLLAFAAGGVTLGILANRSWPQPLGTGKPNTI